MDKLQKGEFAPNFSLPDHTGRVLTLHDLLNDTNALLVFNIGFA